MVEIGEPSQNGRVKWVIRRIKVREVDLSDYEDLHNAYRRIGWHLQD